MYSIPNATKSKTVISSARLAREERAQQRRKEVAVIRIQSASRGFLTRHALAQKWRKDLDILLGRKPDQKTKNVETSSKESSSAVMNPVALDKIPLHSKQLSKEEWQFASFSSNTLTGAYGNLSISDKTKSLQDVKPMEPSEQDGPSSVSSKLKSEEKTLKTQENRLNTSDSDKFLTKQTIETPEKTVNQEIFKKIRQFLYIFQPVKDEQRFTDLCKFLLKNTKTETSTKFSYVSLCVHKQYVLLWISQVKTILWQCCKFLDSAQTSSDSGQMLSVFLGMLVTFTDVSHWKSLKKQTAVHSALQQICISISVDLYIRGAHCVIATVLRKGITLTLTNNLIGCCVTLIFRLFTCQTITDDKLACFVLTVLNIPAFLWQIQDKFPQSLAVLEKHQILFRIVTLLQAEGACSRYRVIPKSCESFSVVTDVLCIAANLIHLCAMHIEVMEKHRVKVVTLLNELFKFLDSNTVVAKSSHNTWHPVLGYFPGNKMELAHGEAMPYVKRQLEFLWNGNFLRILFHDLLTLPSLHNDDVTPSHAEEIANKTKAKVKLSNKLGSYLKKIASSRSQKIVLPTGGRKLEYTEVRNTCSSCLLYRRALAVVTKQLRLKMLTGLTFMSEILCRMWRFICELGPSGGLELFLSSLSLPPEVSEPYFAVFTLFCDMTSHIISILDDVEFYEQQIPFHLEELVVISGALRQFVFKMIWSGIIKASSTSAYPVFDSAHALLMMLYDRDARRPFTPANHWLCKEVKSSVIRSEVEKSQPRAKHILQKIPFALPHKDRVILFRSFVMADKAALGISTDMEEMEYIRVHRSRLVDDGYTKLHTFSVKSLKGVIRVKFVNDLGLDEAGIDQDGVFKEFLEEIISKVFNPDINLFKITTGGESKLYPSPLSHLQDDHLSLFNFVGKMLGKAVYEGIVLDLPFANFFLRSLLANQHSSLYSPIDELPSLDAEFYKNLTWIKRYDGDIADLGLTFTYEEDIMGRVESHELAPGGSALAVTNENKFMYIHKMAHYRMHTQIREQTQAFVSGFRSLISHSWTAMFSAPELQRLISGDNVDMDLTDLKRHVVYYGGFHSSHRVVKWLWDILEKDYAARERASFLKFVTSCSRPPLLGFAHLNPQFSIRCVEVPDEEDTGDTVATVLRGFLGLSASKSRRSHPHRLPTASTCFNLLKLPNYPTKDVLREKLKQAIANNTGFELS